MSKLTFTDDQGNVKTAHTPKQKTLAMLQRNSLSVTLKLEKDKTALVYLTDEEKDAVWMEIYNRDYSGKTELTTPEYHKLNEDVTKAWANALVEKRANAKVSK